MSGGRVELKYSSTRGGERADYSHWHNYHNGGDFDFVRLYGLADADGDRCNFGRADASPHPDSVDFAFLEMHRAHAHSHPGCHGVAVVFNTLVGE